MKQNRQKKKLHEHKKHTVVRLFALTAAILALPPRYREVVLLHCDQGLTIRETARALGITAPAVINRLKKARAALASALGEEDA